MPRVRGVEVDRRDEERAPEQQQPDRGAGRSPRDLDAAAPPPDGRHGRERVGSARVARLAQPLARQGQRLVYLKVRTRDSYF